MEREDKRRAAARASYNAARFLHARQQLTVLGHEIRLFFIETYFELQAKPVEI
jgi:hypothetical protein